MVGDTEKDGKDTIQQFLELKNITEEDGGEYACVANNNEGSTYSEPITVDVTCKILKIVNLFHCCNVEYRHLVGEGRKNDGCTV